jgi:FkbM family methyltransferase
MPARPDFMRPPQTGPSPPGLTHPAPTSRLPLRLRKLLYRNYLRRNRYRRYDRLGLRLLLNYANYVDRKLILHEPYETKPLALLLRETQEQPCDLFVDVGANLGLYALLMAAGGHAPEIHAFEPDPRNYHQCVTNIAFNGLTSRIRLFACGLSDQDRSVDFLEAHARGTGMSRVLATAPAATRRQHYTQRRIPVIRYDSHFTCRDRRVSVKIDVEGHELPVIDGMQRLLQDNDCRLQVEVFDANLKPVDARLATLGYRQYEAIGPDRLYRRP